MSVCSKHFVQTDYKCKWNPNAKVHFLLPDAIPSQNLPVTLHQNIKPVIARSFRKRRNLNESDQDKACANIEFPHHSDETDRTTDEVFMENASVENIRTEIERPSTSREPLIHDQEPVKNVVEFLDKGTQSNIVSSFEERLDTEKKCISFTGVSSDVVDTCVICINEVIKANNGQCIADIRKKVVLVLTKLKSSFACLSVMFDYSPSSCS
nr:uncharacterized protein LOC111515215 [Leptinotarsa decemlineata]